MNKNLYNIRIYQNKNNQKMIKKYKIIKMNKIKISRIIIQIVIFKNKNKKKSYALNAIKKAIMVETVHINLESFAINVIKKAILVETVHINLESYAINVMKKDILQKIANKIKQFAINVMKKVILQKIANKIRLE